MSVKNKLKKRRKSLEISNIPVGEYYGKNQYKNTDFLNHKRDVLISNELKIKIDKSKEISDLFKDIKDAIKNGRLLPFYHNFGKDNSQTFEDEYRKRTGIYHFHVSPRKCIETIEVNDHLRSDNLWMCLILGGTVYFIDIVPHSTWKNHTIHIFNIVLNNWKDLFLFSTGSLKRISSEELSDLQKNTDDAIAKGCKFMPGLLLNDYNYYSIKNDFGYVGVATDGSDRQNF